MKTYLKKWLWFLAFLPCGVQAQVELNVSGAQNRATPVAVVPFINDQRQEIDFIISSDLSKTGLFTLIAPQAYNMRPQSPNDIDYRAFNQIGADFVVVGRVVPQSGAQVMQVGLGNTYQKRIVGNYSVQNPSLRQSAHQISDAILEKLTGVRGAFSTRLAFIRETQRGKRRMYQLMVSDIDGQDRVSLYSNYHPLMSPAWSPDGQKIAYVSYETRDPQIIVQNIYTGARKAVTSGAGTNSSPAWSPDGRRLLYVSSVSGNPEIYVIPVSGGTPQRLTNHPGIDTEPSWSPDGQSIYFTSDRSGKPQIYRMSAAGGAATRVVASQDYQAGSTLSPDGRYLALTRQAGGNQIGLYELQSGAFMPLTHGRLDEGGSFAPNGQMLIYSTVQGGQAVLKLVNMRGEVVSTLSESGARLRHPAWGPDTRR